MVSLGVSFNLQVEDQDLVEVCLPDILDPFDFNQFSYALGLYHSFKSCVLTPSLLFHVLFLSPV